MALDEHASRRLVRRLPDGQLSRSSSAEYLIPLAGMAGLGQWPVKISRTSRAA